MKNYNPNIWGPHAWIFIDTIVLNYPINPTDEDKLIYKNFFDILKYIIPCSKCRINYINNLKKYPISDIVLSTKDNLINWILNIHNEIRIEHNKNPIKKTSFRDYYDKIYNINNDNQSTRVILLFIIIICILLLQYFYRNIISK